MGAEGSVKPAKGDALPLDQARSYLDEKRRQCVLPRLRVQVSGRG